MLGAAMVFAVGCGNGDDDSGPASTGDSLDHTWEYLSADGTSGSGLTFTSDGKYQALHLVLTSSTSANVEETTGTYSVSGNSISFTPEEGTCSAPQSPETDTFVLSGTSLTLSLAEGVVVFQVDTSTTSNAAITYGCFDSEDNFTPEPLGPLGSETQDAGQ